MDDTHTAKALGLGLAPARTADNLLKQALDAGAPDNVTVVLVDVGGQHPLFSGTPTVVGSASNPEGVAVPAARPGRSSWLHPNRQAANEPTHYEPAPEFLEELIEEDRRRARRRRIGWIVGFVLVVALIVAGLIGGYAWTQTRYFVGADDDSVVIFRGVQQSLGPISLSSVYQDTDIPLDELSSFQRVAVEETISADSLEDALQIVARLRPPEGDAG